jgi:hypothetical protein
MLTTAGYTTGSRGSGLWAPPGLGSSCRSGLGAGGRACICAPAAGLPPRSRSRSPRGAPRSGRMPRSERAGAGVGSCTVWHGVKQANIRSQVMAHVMQQPQAVPSFSFFCSPRKIHPLQLHLKKEEHKVRHIIAKRATKNGKVLTVPKGLELLL